MLFIWRKYNLHSLKQAGLYQTEVDIQGIKSKFQIRLIQLQFLQYNKKRGGF